MDHMQHGVLNWWKTFLLSDLWTCSSSQRFTFSFSSPSSWRSFSGFYQYHTVATPCLSFLLYSVVECSGQPSVESFTCLTFRQFGNAKPLSTPWQCTCHLLFAVVKVIYAASVLLLWRTPRFRHLSSSFHFHLSD